MAKKNYTTPSLVSLLGKYNDALKQDKPSKYTNIEFEVRFAQMSNDRANDFDKIYDDLIKRGFKVEFRNYLLRIDVTYQKDHKEERAEHLSNIRVELDDMNHIQELCNKNTLNSNARFVSKRHIDEKHNGPYMIYDYKMRVSIQKEVERLPQTSEQVLMIQNRWDKSYKNFRYIYRTSLVHEDMPNIRIDLSKVKSNRNKSVYFVESNVLSEDEKYEVEIELINIDRPFDEGKKNNILTQLKSAVKYVLSSLQGSQFPVKYDELDAIYKDYMSLLKIVVQKFKKDEQKRSLNSKYSKSGRHFIGPSSCTLQPINLVDDDSIDNICLRRDMFCVTDKADGERKMLYIGNNLSLYFINTNLEIQFTGVKIKNMADYKNTLIDGEYITSNKSGESISLYAAFDIYFFKGDDVRNNPFKKKDGNNKGSPVISRRELLLEAIDNINNNADKKKHLTITAKSFFFATENNLDSLYAANDNCLKHAQTLDYETDGLIYTPMTLGVTQESAVEPPKAKNFKYTWSQSFKWKPPEYNTIDFLISIDKDAFNKPKMKQKMIDGAIVNYYTLKLHVGVDKIKHGLIGSQQKLLNEEFKLQISGEEIIDTDKYPDRYAAELFYPTNPSDPMAHLCHVLLHLHEGKLHMFTEENQIIEDDTIVEFRYDMNAKDKMNSWIPLRIREDKTKDYRTKRNNFGNAYHVANSNWHSIYNPVTKKMLTGETEVSVVDALNNDGDVYYNNRNAKREKSHTIKLRKFHNFVKELLIRYAASKKENTVLIDMAVGKAGDLHKWLNNNVRGVLGIDISEDNIHNPYDGACKRYIELFTQKKMKRGNNKTKNEQNMFGMFISGDTSKNIENGNFDMYSHKNKQSVSSDYILKSLLGSVPSKNIKEEYLKTDIFKNKFDICSIQFAIHYMFESKEKLYMFAKNVSDMTRVGSYFIGTCYDGKLVYDKLKDVEYNKAVEIYKNSKKIWSIRKKYHDSDDSFMENTELSLGRKISVFQESINKEFDEYLVNFDYFEKVMRDHGFAIDTDFAVEDQEMNATESFEVIYKKLYQNGKQTNITNYEKEISFLNRCFVFKKINDNVKSYPITDEHDANEKPTSFTSVGYPKKTGEIVTLQL